METSCGKKNVVKLFDINSTLNEDLDIMCQKYDMHFSILNIVRLIWISDTG